MGSVAIGAGSGASAAARQLATRVPPQKVEGTLCVELVIPHRNRLPPVGPLVPSEHIHLLTSISELLAWAPEDWGCKGDQDRFGPQPPGA